MEIKTNLQQELLYSFLETKSVIICLRFVDFQWIPLNVKFHGGLLEGLGFLVKLEKCFYFIINHYSFTFVDLSQETAKPHEITLQLLLPLTEVTSLTCDVTCH